MYTLILDEGVVLDAAGTQVAPCQSADDPAFTAYVAWVYAGNEPTIIETRG
jgi:hypothetical protein